MSYLICHSVLQVKVLFLLLGFMFCFGVSNAIMRGYMVTFELTLFVFEMKFLIVHLIKLKLFPYV